MQENLTENYKCRRITTKLLIILYLNQKLQEIFANADYRKK